MVVDRVDVAEADRASGAEVLGCEVDVGGHHYRYRCGIAWRDLPEVFGPWQTVWTWHHRLAAGGTWDTIVSTLIAQADAEGLVDWSVSVDSTDRPGASARDEHDSPHRGLDRITRIRPSNRVITASAAPKAGGRQKSISSSMATGSR